LELLDALPVEVAAPLMDEPVLQPANVRPVTASATNATFEE
jgi:hypothetical protein